MGEHGQVECQERVRQLGQGVRLAVPDRRPNQLRAGPGKRQVRLIGNGWPLWMAVTGPSMPGGGHLREPALGRLEPFDRARPGGWHVNVEDPGEGWLVREK